MDPLQAVETAISLLGAPLGPSQQEKAKAIMDAALDRMLKEFGVAPQDVKPMGGYDGKRKAGK